MCSLEEKECGIFASNKWNLQAVDILLTDSAWITTLEAAVQYYKFADARSDKKEAKYAAFA